MSHKTTFYNSILNCLLFIISVSSYSQTTLIQDNFDSGWGNWNSGGSDTFLVNPTPLNSSQGVNLQDNSGNSSAIYTNNISLTSYGSASIEFDYRTKSFWWGLDFFIEYSSDGGANWSEIGRYRNVVNFNNDTNYTETITIDANNYSFTTIGKFRIRCDANNDNNDLFIDNVTIIGYPPSPEINLQSNSLDIVDGDTEPYNIDNTDYGSAALGTTMTRTFTIENNGTAALNISSITLSNTTDYSITGTTYSSPVSILGSTTFSIRFNSLTVGQTTTNVIINNDDSDENPYNFLISAKATVSFFDSDGDGVLDNRDIDDDNDGIKDSVEELACKNSNISLTTNYKFLNETFGTGNRAEINTTYDAVTTYCYEDGTASCPTFGGIDLNDGEYTVYYKSADGDGINDTPNEEVASWADQYWYIGDDHTSGDTDGRMAMFNAAYEPGIFYTASITGALPNIPVTYSFWVINLDTSDAPGIATRLRPNILVEFRDVDDNILASITTGDIAPTTAEKTTGDWYNFTADLIFPVSEFNVYFYNNQTGGAGNDLAIDDIDITQTLCDTDSDGVADVFDLDSDNDGIPDIVEAGFGSVSNGKGKIDTFYDSNGNGMHDAFEGLTILDSDDDGTPNFIDLDSDNDTIFDVDESGAGNTADSNYENGDGDIDGDGVGDGLDTDAVREKDFNSDGNSEYFTDGILDIFDYFNGSTIATAYGNSNQGNEYTYFLLDSDNDGKPDYIDIYNNSNSTYDISNTLYANLDTNNDGKIDDTNDVDRDGILDLFDTDESVFGSPRNIDHKLQLFFDGRNDYVQDVSISSGWSEISLMGWIKIDPSASGTKVLFGQENFYLRLNNSNQLYLFASGTTLTNSASLATNQWIHIAATYSASDGSIVLYINGEEIVEKSKTGALNTENSLFTISRSANNSEYFFKGYIDEVRLFDKALTEDELQKIVYQEIENNGNIKGSIIPRDISTLSWSNLIRYYRLDGFKGDITDDLTTPTVDIDSGAKLYNIKTITYQSAPMPFISQQGNTDLAIAISKTEDGVNGNDAVNYDWSIVHVQHDDITFNNTQRHLGLFIDEEDSSSNPIEYHITDDSELNISWYLKLDGFIDLEGESQLIQGDDSMLDPTSKGKIERDQQGTSDTYTYNYWSSPVGITNNSSNNNDYSLRSVLMDGTNPENPQSINFVSGYDGTNSSPIGIAKYWIWKFDNYQNDDYASWQHVQSIGTLSAGEGYTMKGPGTGAILDNQNYTFVGKPNNGDIELTLSAGNSYLVGNPYPSAIDAQQFIIDNGGILNYDPNVTDPESPADTTPLISGTLYFWEHWGGGSHILSEYQGGYAIYNFSGAVAAPSYGTNDPDVATGGSPTKLPGRYIPVGQGFFVIGDNTGTLKFSNNQRIFVKEGSSNSVFTRSTQTNNTLDVTQDDIRMKFRLGFNSVGTIHRQILLTIDEQYATSSIDRGFDAIIFDDLIDDMYWMIEGEKFSIQGYGSIDENTVIPIGLHTAQNGINEIIIDDLENIPDDLSIYLHDNVLDIYHNLRQSSYQIDLNAGNYLNRFAMTFKVPETLSNNEIGIEDLKFFHAVNRNNVVILNPKSIELKELQLFNINGQSIYSNKKMRSNTYDEYNMPKLSTGIYIIKLLTVKGEISKKIIIK
ncbi:LamG-like jellyroll fold domain-containing protein [Winogradskyella sp. PG-2]|uniref:LamG-like jellyroll fold domain-containing protein n=1 Tax=Winogradskyella sp. PG-2 TaxID=754409 RepID=UPI000458922E|nr:LamG-like jellyroll fold domain-containing protein [Winogradskyella sp. PG-2]BAO76893.1 hypothetical protein WPG_2663 [Winogradskyella sp. PG-2]